MNTRGSGNITKYRDRVTEKGNLLRGEGFEETPDILHQSGRLGVVTVRDERLCASPAKKKTMVISSNTLLTNHGRTRGVGFKENKAHLELLHTDIVLSTDEQLQCLEGHHSQGTSRNDTAQTLHDGIDLNGLLVDASLNEQVQELLRILPTGEGNATVNDHKNKSPQDSRETNEQ